jgi:hypothetical protein
VPSERWANDAKRKRVFLGMDSAWKGNGICSGEGSWGKLIEQVRLCSLNSSSL